MCRGANWQTKPTMVSCRGALSNPDLLPYASAHSIPEGAVPLRPHGSRSASRRTLAAYRRGYHAPGEARLAHWEPRGFSGPAQSKIGSEIGKECAPKNYSADFNIGFGLGWRTERLSNGPRSANTLSCQTAQNTEFDIKGEFSQVSNLPCAQMRRHVCQSKLLAARTKD